MTISEITRFEFVTAENGRYRINPRKALNTFTLNAVLSLLKSEGYTFFRLFDGGDIYATKA